MSSYKKDYEGLDIFPDNLKRALLRAGINTLKEIVTLGDWELKKIDGIGPATVREINRYLSKENV